MESEGEMKLRVADTMDPRRTKSASWAKTPEADSALMARANVAIRIMLRVL